MRGQGRDSSRRRTNSSNTKRSRAVFETIERRLLFTRIAIVGDFSADAQTTPVQNVSNLVKSWSPEGVVTVGDNNYPSGQASTIDNNIGRWYHDFIYPYANLNGYGPGSADGQNHFWPTPGNHDWDSSDGTLAPYRSYFTLPNNERYYTVQIGNIAIFAVDSDNREPDGVGSNSVQAQWIHAQMQASTATWKLVAFHESPYTSGQHGNNVTMQWPFKDWGVTAVLTGHDHLYERLSEGGLTYIVNGLGGESIAGFDNPIPGSQVRYNDDYGAMRIDSTDTQITFNFYTRDNDLIDTYTLTGSGPVPTQTLIPQGAVWKYLDNGTNQGTAWRALAYVDSAWASGPAQLGYGDSDESTVVSYGPNSNNKYITTYFRKSFTVADPSNIASLALNLVRDDGAVVYLNGAEVYRDNMPSGTIGYTTLSSTTVGDLEESAWHPASINPSLLAAGNNVIAVEIHQVVADSTDISFDFQLSATLNAETAPTAPSGLSATLSGSNQITLNWTDNSSNELSFRIERSTDGVNFAQIRTAPAGTISFIDTNLTSGATYWYRVRAAGSTVFSSYSNIANSAIPGTPNTQVLLAGGSIWKYLDDGSNQGTAWRATGFTDTSWKTGAAQLGYGDGDEATLVGWGADDEAKFITTYFRKSFTVANPATIGSLLMRLVRDDGAVVYLNGTEVFRSNMPAGTIAYTTPATNGIEDNSWQTAAVSPALLLAGTNVIAVEIHQSDPTSTDLSFDLDLTATLAAAPAAPTGLLAAAAPSAIQINLVWKDNSSNETGFKIERSLNGTSGWTQIATPAANATSYADTTGLSSGTRYYYRVRATNAVNDSAYSNTANAMTIAATTQTLIAAGATWRYLDNGSNQGTAWRATAFNDAAWKTGAAQLGYGDGDEATIVSYGPNANNKYITTYFRKAFSVANAAAVTAMTLNLMRDDGAVVYLNGTEVYRNNMPTGTITSSTLAATTINAPDESAWYTTNIALGSLVTGNNVIAVEIHQSVVDSSDISFNFSLAATVIALPPPPPALAAPSGLKATVISSSQINLSWVDTTTGENGFSIERSINGGAFAEIATVGAGVTSYSNTLLSGSTTYSYRIRAFKTGGIYSFYSGPVSATTPGAISLAAGGATTLSLNRQAPGLLA